MLNPPSVSQLKQLSTRHPHQPVSGALIKEIDDCRDLIHEQFISIIKLEQIDGECNPDIRIDDESSIPERPSQYAYPHRENITEEKIIWYPMSWEGIFGESQMQKILKHASMSF